MFRCRFLVLWIASGGRVEGWSFHCLATVLLAYVYTEMAPVTNLILLDGLLDLFVYSEGDIWEAGRRRTFRRRSSLIEDRTGMRKIILPAARRARPKRVVIPGFTSLHLIQISKTNGIICHEGALRQTKHTERVYLIRMKARPVYSGPFPVHETGVALFGDKGPPGAANKQRGRLSLVFRIDGSARMICCRTTDPQGRRKWRKAFHAAKAGLPGGSRSKSGIMKRTAKVPRRIISESSLMKRGIARGPRPRSVK